MRVKLGCCLFIGWCLINSALALDGLSLSAGSGRPSDLKGGRIAAQWSWHQGWLQSHNWQLDTYWDMSFAHWHTDGNPDDNYAHKALSSFALAPIFRWERTTPYLINFRPYLEASWGLTVLTDQHLSYRNQGAHWAFQDLIGLGVRFGERGQYDLSYHYLHYSNAGINPPNNGIDIKILLTLQYRFS